MLAGSITLLLIFTLVASVDGFYFHIYRYRLYARPASRREHLLHTANAVLFPFTLAPLYLAEATGLWLVATALLHALTFAIESLDVFTEQSSRAPLGGLTSTEYWMHFAMSGLRWGYVALAFAAIGAGAWSAETAWIWRFPTLDAPSAIIAWAIAIVGLPVAVLHVLLARQGRGRRVAEGVLFVRILAPS